MAALQYAAGTTASLRRSKTLNSRKPISIISSSFTSSFPAKPTKRKNHLRQKILKKLEKPITPEPPTLSPIIPLETKSDHGTFQEIQESEKPETSEVEILEKTQILNPARADLDKSVARNSISNYVLWLVGAFVFQTVCAIWVFSSAGADDENRVSNGTEQGSVRDVGGNGEGKSRVGFVRNVNGNLRPVYVDQLEMETKIGEIQVMAGKVREMEKLKSNKNVVFEGNGMNEGKHVKNEVEIDDGLIKLRNQLEKVHGKVPAASVEYLRKQVESKDWAEKGEGLDEIGSNGELVFKKKYKFRGANPTEKPKGFGRSKYGKSGKSKKNSALDIGMAYDELSKGIDSSGSERVVEATSALTWESGTKFWWLSLPYVLVIVMRRGQIGEGGEGFYTLDFESISSRDDQISRMVAFEDRKDATNFCFLLQSFFNDVEDFEADVVPLTVKELNEAAKHYSSRPVVVKRGQLQLYAGQPLGDAEMALRAIEI